MEYGDYECPYCGAAYPVIKEIQNHLEGGLRFVFRNFPLTTVHPHAEEAAEAAEAAAAQGHFWDRTWQRSTRSTAQAAPTARSNDRGGEARAACQAR